MVGKIPFEIREAVVAVCGKAFWLKDPFRAFLVSCGVAAPLYDRYAEESKFKIARHILAELDGMGDEGFLVQRRIVTELCKLRKVPDENVPDREAALQALRWLKQLAVDQKLYVEEAQSPGEARVAEARRKQAAIAVRAQKMEQLRSGFNQMVVSRDDPQARGYGFEDLLAYFPHFRSMIWRR
jgi:hypothetical protein